MKPFETLGEFYSLFIDRIEKFTTVRFWRIKLVVVLTLVSLIFSTGPLPGVFRDFQTSRGWQSFSEKKSHPLSQPDFNPGSNAAKRTFRLTVPLIAKIFHLPDLAVLLLQFLMSMLFIYFAILLTERITRDSVTAVLTATGLMFIYTGHAGFTDADAWFDEFAFLFLLLAMLSPNSWLIFLWTQLAAWTDERGWVACGLIFIWWKLKELSSEKFDLKTFFLPGKLSSVVLISIVVYIVSRFALSHFIGLYTPQMGVEYRYKGLSSSLNFLGIGTWGALEGFWVLLIVTFGYLISHKRFFAAISLSFMLAVIMFIAFSVYDVSRSAAYLFPIIFISILILSEKFSKKDLQKILVICAGISLLFPSYYIITTRPPYIIWFKPIFIKAIELLSH